jgi:hypothetical protein
MSILPRINSAILRDGVLTVLCSNPDSYRDRHCAKRQNEHSPDRQRTDRKTKEIMPTLRKIKRAVSPRPSRHKTAHLILSNAPKPTHHPKIVENFFGLFLSIKLFFLVLDNI